MQSRHRGFEQFLALAYRKLDSKINKRLLVTFIEASLRFMISVFPGHAFIQYAESSLVFVFVEGSVQEMYHNNNNDQ